MKVLLYCLAIFIACSLLSVESQPTARCPVESKSVKDTVQRSAAVFSGEVLAVQSSVNLLEARFQVEQSWKGVTTDEVSISTDGTAESPHYQAAEKYLVFAGLQQGKLFTGMCSRTKKLEYAQKDLDQLGEGQSHRTK